MALETDRARRAPHGLLAATLAGGLLVAALRGGSYGPVERGELFVVMLWMLAVGVTLGLLPRYRLRRGGAIAVGALVLLAGWMALGLRWTESAERTMVEIARTLGFAGLLLLVLSTFGGRAWKVATGLLTATALLVCAMALASRLAPDVLASPLTASGLFRRLAYPLDYWNGLGSWAAMSAALALAFSAHARSSWIRGGALGGLCLASSVAYLTYSRSSVIAILLAVVAVVAVSRHRSQTAFNALLAAIGAGGIITAIRGQPEVAEGLGTQGAGEVVLVTALVLGACLLAGPAGLTGFLSTFRLSARATRTVMACTVATAVVAGAVVGPALAERAWESFERREESRAVDDPAERLGNLSGIRLQLWRVALDAFSEQPVHGTGAGTYEYVWNRDPRRDAPVRDAHSLFVEALAELGLPGALLLLVALGSLLLTAFRAPFLQPDAPAAGAAAGCAGALLVFFVTAGVDWMWELTAVAALGLVCGGLASAAGAGRAPRLGVPARLAAALLAFLMLAVQLPVLVAAAQIRESRQAIRDGRVEEAIADATTAIDAQPWGATGYLQRAVVLERAGLLPAAAADAREAIRRERTNWQTWLILGRIEVERGRISAGLDAARRARALNPRSPLFSPPPP